MQPHRSFLDLRAALFAGLAGGLATFAPSAALADLAPNGPAIELHRLSGPVVIDGDISDAAWVDSALVDTWWETNPGDNLEPKVKNLAWMGYDDGYLYAAFKFEDSAAGSIRAPLGDRDSIGSPNDYGGVILDPRGDGKTAQMFLANPRGIQYDALTSDDAGEDSSPDFFWESAGRITENGWTLEIRIPFSSIRYVESNPRNWGILLYRNHPRDYRYQYFSSRLPRERNCFICNSRELTGLADLPTGDQYVIAPFATASQLAEPENGVGTPLRTADPESEIGLDAKWIPNPDTVIDGTINPDFSQIETDTAQITANERFALFLPEKRPFFLESVDLFSTPINAVYTRSFSNPEWGGRITGSSTRDKYTVLVGQDEAGGSLILPGPEGSDLADADFDSTVVLARYRHDFGKAFAGLIYSGREIPDEGSAYNRVVGPDFEWRPNGQNTVRGQFLVSQSQTPDRRDLTEEWDGGELDGYAGDVWWNFANGKVDTFVEYKEISDEFRADVGFVPQVGYRLAYGEGGYTWRSEERAIRRFRSFVYGQVEDALDGRPLRRLVTPGFGLDTKLNTFVRLEVPVDEIRGGDQMFDRVRTQLTVDSRPGRVLNQVVLTVLTGDDVDFQENRQATGTTIQFTTALRLGTHLAISGTANRRWLDLAEPPVEDAGRLLTADVMRVKAVYTFNSRMWLRLIGQWVETERDPLQFSTEVVAREADFSGSGVFAYKLNWQTVIYVGYADNRLLDDFEDLQPDNRQAFIKLSYAFRS